jgi:hypothetical protein
MTQQYWSKQTSCRTEYAGGVIHWCDTNIVERSETVVIYCIIYYIIITALPAITSTSGLEDVNTCILLISPNGTKWSEAVVSGN